MQGNQRILIRKDSCWEDVTEKNAIIYGAGQGCLDLMSEWQVPNVKFVIDSDEHKWGKNLLLLDQEYLVQSPDILFDLALEKYYIIISSDIYAEEIIKKIMEYVDINKVSICEDRRALCFSYSSLENLLFYDPRIKKLLVITNWSCKLEKLISIFASVSKQVFLGETIEQYISIGYGYSKMTFCFCIKNDFYVFSIPALYCEMEAYVHHPNERKKKCLFRKEYGIEPELTLYEDISGVLIQHFGLPFPNYRSDEYKRAVLEKSYILHQLNYRLDISHNFFKETYENTLKHLCSIMPYERKRFEQISLQFDSVFEELDKGCQEFRICHGDLHNANTVLWNGKVFFIDWEHMAMGNPMYDVSTFLYYCGVLDGTKNGFTYGRMAKDIYLTLRKYLSFYYGRKCTDAEYHYACLAMQAKEGQNFLYTSLSMHYIDNERYEDLLTRLKNRGG